MNGGSDTETEGSDTEYPSMAKRSKKIEVQADIFMRNLKTILRMNRKPTQPTVKITRKRLM
jgi:hypothetical protein